MTSVLSAFRADVRRSPLFMSVVAVLALAAAIVNSAASVGFPVGAGWERVFNVLVTVDLVIIAAVLVVAAILVSRSSRSAARASDTVLDRAGRPVPSGRIGVLSVVGLGLLGVDWILWLAIALPTLIGGIATGGAAYLSTTFTTALFGPLWVVGTAFAVIGFHRGGSSRNRTMSLVGAGLTVGMMAVVVLVATLYAAGMVR